MNHIVERIYYKCPAAVQNVAVSLYGLHLKNQRSGGKYLRYVRALEQSETLSAEEMQRLQIDELQRLLSHSFATVPFFRKCAKEQGLSADMFSKAEDLKRLPVIPKERLRAAPDEFLSDLYRGKTFKLSTSGTSGKPLSIYCDKDSRRRHYAFWQRFRKWFGILPGMKRATFFGRIIIPADHRHPPFWRYDAFQNNYLFSSYHMSNDNLKCYYEALLEIQPQEIIGYPSSLFLLAKYMKKNHLRDVRPVAVFTTAETLLAHQRALIEDVFQQKIADQYGCTEMALFMSQCEKGSYHVHPEHGIVEVLDQKGNSVGPGEPGEAVCTGFVNYAMPMIRYRLGDRLIAGTEGCACGRQFPVVKQLLGRADDILIAPDGRPLGRLDPIFKGLTDIYETQILQTAPDRLTLKMVADQNFSRKKKDELLYEVRKRTGNEMRIDMEMVGEIPKDRNGKFRSVISLIGKATDISDAD
jgi:phenylacetate-CoA ligase